MSEFNRQELYGRLNSLFRRVMEKATDACNFHGNPRVELVHVVQQVFLLGDSDLLRILHYFQFDIAKLSQGVTQALEQLPSGAESFDISPTVDRAVQAGWDCTSHYFYESTIRTGHLITAILQSDTLRGRLLSISQEFAKVDVEELLSKFADIVDGSPEDDYPATNEDFVTSDERAPDFNSRIKRAASFGKLNSIAYHSIEAGTAHCKRAGNHWVELSHWLDQILQLSDSDLLRIARNYNVDPVALTRDLTQSLDRLPRGAESIEGFSQVIDDVVKEGWFYATLMFGELQVRTGHLVIALLKTRSLHRAFLEISREFEKIDVDHLIDNFDEILSDSPEVGLAAKDGFAAPAQLNEVAAARTRSRDALATFTMDLTEHARQGKMDPVACRDDEIRQIIDILMRRQQKVPLLIGDRGAGKTAVVEGLAQQIVAGDVPPNLRNVAIRTVDVGLLQAGASEDGEFERRLQQVLEEAQTSETPILLFLDEAHTCLSPSENFTGAANLLRPAVARGELRFIAAASTPDYEMHLQNDPAMAKVCEIVHVNELSEEDSIRVLRAINRRMEEYHSVQIFDEAIQAAVRLSHRCFPSRPLPLKAISLLDSVATQVATSHEAVPTDVAECRRRLESLELSLQIAENENAMGIRDDGSPDTITQELNAELERLKELESRWQEEKRLVAQIVDIRQRLRRNVVQDRQQTLAQLRELNKELAALQGQRPWILSCVDGDAVALSVAEQTDIPPRAPPPP